MPLPDSFLQELMARSDIESVVSSYVNMKRRGRNLVGLCPFHGEKTPSFTLYPETSSFYCFGCGAGGNVFTFIMNYENYTFAEAIKLLADRAGIALPEIEDSKEAREKENRRKTLLQINKEAATYFYYQLRAPQGRVGLDYLKGRQLSDETMNRFGLGYSNKTSNDLCQYLRHKGYPDELIRESGVAVFNEKYGMSDKFWNRVMFPIQDVNHRVIGFGGRVMGEGEPKYLNSPETPVFDKSRNLYGLNFARTARQDNIILCEGYMDVIAMHQAGFTQAVASLGTAFTSGQANLLRRYTENVILSYDSDGAGVKAALRAIGILKEAGLTGKVLNLEPYKDPDEFMKNLGREEFAKRLSQAENTFFFELRMMQKQYDLSDPEAKTKFYNEIAKKLCGFSEEVERENYTEAVAEKYNISMESLKKLVTGYAAKMGMAAEVIRPKQPVQQKNTPKEQQENVQKLLLTWLVEEPHLYKKIKKYITPLSFTNELYRQVAQELFPKLEEGKPNPAAIISRFSQEEEQREAASLFNTKLPYMQQDMESQSQVQEREKAFHDIVVKVKRNAYEHDLKASGSDMEALSRVISGRQELDELEKTHISFD